MSLLGEVLVLLTFLTLLLGLSENKPAIDVNDDKIGKVK